MNRVDLIIYEFNSYKNSFKPKCKDRIFQKDDRMRLENIKALVSFIFFTPLVGFYIVVTKHMLVEEITSVNFVIIFLLVSMAATSIWNLLTQGIRIKMFKGIIGPQFYKKYVQTVYRKVFEKDKLVLKRIIVDKKLDLATIYRRIEYRSKESITRDSHSAFAIAVFSFAISVFTIIDTYFPNIYEFIENQFIIQNETTVNTVSFLLTLGIIMYIAIIIRNFDNKDYYLYQLVEEILYCDLYTQNIFDNRKKV